MNGKKLKALLLDYGYEFERIGKGAHQIWRHSATGATVLFSPNKRDSSLKAFLCDLKRGARLAA